MDRWKIPNIMNYMDTYHKNITAIIKENKHQRQESRHFGSFTRNIRSWR